MDVKKFQKLLFHAPDPRRSAVFVVVTGLIYGLLTAWLLSGTFHRWQYFSVLYFVPSLVYALVTNLSVRKFFKRRACLLGFTNQTLLFFGIVLLNYLPLESSRFFFGSLAFIYSVNVLSFSGISNTKGPRTLFVPWVYILLVGTPFSSPLFTVTQYQLILSYVGVFLFGSFTLFLIYLVEFFFKLTVPDSPLKLFSAFLNKDPISLESGIDITTPLQKLKFKSDDREHEISLPWVHPGPGASLGGGALSTKIIEELNDGGSGYFWHVPSCHEQDPAEPEVVDRILENDDGNKKRSSTATKLHKVESDSYVLQGHRIGDLFLVFLRGSEDDFDLSIFRDIKKRVDGDVVFVDRHPHSPYTHDKLLSYGEDGTEKLEEGVFKLVEKLRDAEQHPIESATEVSDNGKFMLLALQIENETYLYVTLDINGISEELERKLTEIKKNSDFDTVLSLTTDAHENVKFLSMEDDLDLDSLAASAHGIKGKLKRTEMEFTETEMDVSVLGKNSYILETNTKWALHLFPILLAIHYVILLLFVL